MPLRRGRPHHQPWALCRVPDGRGRHSARSVRRHSADDRGTATAASHINRVMHSFVTHPSQAHGCASMTENSVIFNARHGAGSFHPHQQPAPTAQDCLKGGTGANWQTTRQLSGECRRNSQGGGPKRAEVGQDTGSVDTEREEYAFWASALSSTV